MNHFSPAGIHQHETFHPSHVGHRLNQPDNSIPVAGQQRFWHTRSEGHRLCRLNVIQFLTRQRVRNHTSRFQQLIGEPLVEGTGDQPGHNVDPYECYDEREDQVRDDDLVSNVERQKTAQSLKPSPLLFRFLCHRHLVGRFETNHCPSPILTTRHYGSYSKVRQRLAYPFFDR